jgi:N12 class adenine-specific DNA methylase
MLGQFSSELLTLYPVANILVAGKEDFESQNRKKLFSRIATGNWFQGGDFG